MAFFIAKVKNSKKIGYQVGALQRLVEFNAGLMFGGVEMGDIIT